MQYTKNFTQEEKEWLDKFLFEHLTSLEFTPEDGRKIASQIWSKLTGNKTAFCSACGYWTIDTIGCVNIRCEKSLGKQEINKLIE